MSGLDFEIRDARVDDLASIVAIYNASIPSRNATADTTPATVDSRREWFYQHDAARRPLWVAESAGLVAGYLSFRSFYGRPAYHITAEIGLYVRPDVQRRGIGRRMLSRAIATAPGCGLENLLAFIFGHNGASLSLFRQLGFETWGTLPGVADLDGARRDLVILGRRV